MIKSFINHAIRKDILRKNKKINHLQYRDALPWLSRLTYTAGDHKKKLIFFVVVSLVCWTYDWHKSLYYWVLSFRSPTQFVANLMFGSEKEEITVHEQKVVGWDMNKETLDCLTRLYYETDRKLIFGVGRNYLFHVYSELGVLQK